MDELSHDLQQESVQNHKKKKKQERKKSETKKRKKLDDNKRGEELKSSEALLVFVFMIVGIYMGIRMRKLIYVLVF